MSSLVLNPKKTRSLNLSLHLQDHSYLAKYWENEQIIEDLQIFLVNL